MELVQLRLLPFQNMFLDLVNNAQRRPFKMNTFDLMSRLVMLCFVKEKQKITQSKIK